MTSPRSGSRRSAPHFAVIAAVCLGALGPSPALAQASDADKAAALQAWNDGKDLEKKADYAAALAKFQKVGTFKMTPHVRFHIALCEEKLGKLVSALHGFELAQAEALKMGKDGQEVSEKAPARVEALRKRVAAVRIEVKGKVLYSRVLLDGQPLLTKDFGTLMAVDPGKHAIEVESDGAIAQKREVTLPEKGYETITLEIEDKERPVSAEAATASATATTSASPPLTSTGSPPPPPSKLPVFALGGLGVASLIGAGVFYGLRVGALSEFDALCADQGEAVRSCTTAAEGSYNDAQAFTLAAGVLVGVGAAALGGAGAYWLLTRPAAGSGKKPAVGVSVSPSGIRLLGKF